jgi:hypothetical protein
MDKNLVIDTVWSLRTALHRRITGVLTPTRADDDVWQTLQAADHLIDELKKDGAKVEDATSAEKDLVTTLLCMAQPYIRECGRFQGMIEMLKRRHTFLAEKYNPVGPLNRDEMAEAGRDFWMLCNLLEREKQNAVDEPFGIPGSTTESGGSGHIQPREQ